ncbi:hypothetical protein KIN20_033581 [Parelaphostrongylus tenuis]|uniref:DNA ligase ATP-dependent N-terminal domain-containing protein n=1 Tax=Parelaphostrongylus tenuis TaxID=148309 RepID=A0AAD5R8U9_PARTN|nr:hypothetical protein KIN20_033581 [Parelaphostrongylus tenuis]
MVHDEAVFTVDNIKAVSEDSAPRRWIDGKQELRVGEIVTLALTRRESFFSSLLISLKLHRVWLSWAKENMEEVEWPMITRLKIVEVLADFFAKVIENSPDDLSNCAYLCVNRLGPAYKGVELGMPEHTINEIAQVRECVHNTVSSFISDAEIVAWDESAKSFSSLQVLTIGKRTVVPFYR